MSWQIINSSGSIKVQGSTGPTGPTGASGAVGNFAFPNVLVPSALTGNVDDWNPAGLSGSTLIRVSTTTGSEIRGVVAQATGSGLVLVNVSNATLTVRAQATTSATGNRFNLGLGVTGTTTIANGAGLQFYYDGLLSNWVIL